MKNTFWEGATDNKSVSQCLIHVPVKGATEIKSKLTEACLISIHAPVKGATRTAILNLQDELISIHAPVKGAT